MTICNHKSTVAGMSDDKVKVKGIIATDNICLDNTKFSPSALKQIRDQVVGKPIYYNFDITRYIGVAIEVTDKKNVVEIVADIDPFKLPMDCIFYMSLSFVCEKDSWESGGGKIKRTIEDIELVSLGLCMQSIDKSIPPIERVGLIVKERV